MSKSNKYGYVGTIPEQSVRDNKGVFETNEINQLYQDNKWTTFGDLELIQTEVITSATAVDFENIQPNKYDIHFLTFHDITTTGGSDSVSIRLSSTGSYSYATTTYNIAIRYGTSGGTFGEINNTSASGITDLSGNIAGVNQRANGYVYMYNLGNPDKRNFFNFHSTTTIYNTLELQNRYGSGLYNVTTPIQAIRVDGDSFTGSISNGTISLYGIRGI